MTPEIIVIFPKIGRVLSPRILVFSSSHFAVVAAKRRNDLRRHFVLQIGSVSSNRSAQICAPLRASIS